MIVKCNNPECASTGEALYGRDGNPYPPRGWWVWRRMELPVGTPWICGCQWWCMMAAAAHHRLPQPSRGGYDPYMSPGRVPGGEDR